MREGSGPRALGNDGGGDHDGEAQTPIGAAAIGAKAIRIAGRLTIFEFSGAPLLARPLQRGVGRNCTRARSATDRGPAGTKGTPLMRGESLRCAARRGSARNLGFACAPQLRVGWQTDDDARVCRENASSYHRQVLCAGTALPEVERQTRQKGHGPWQARSLTPSAFHSHRRRRYEQ